MTELQTAEEYLNYAKRVAFKMWKDPEAESIAGFAALRAMRSFDPSKEVPTRRWVARFVKQRIWQHWRKRAQRREELHTELWWEHVAETPPIEDLGFDPIDMKFLYEYFIEKWCLDVIARRYGVTVYSVKLRIAASVARLKEVHGA